MKTGYKGLGEDDRCRGLEYPMWRQVEYTGDKPISLCDRGLHYCEHVLDCFDYYPPVMIRHSNTVWTENRQLILSHYATVDAEGTNDELSFDSKRVAKSIKVQGRLVSASDFVSHVGRYADEKGHDDGMHTRFHDFNTVRQYENDMVCMKPYHKAVRYGHNTYISCKLPDGSAYHDEITIPAAITAGEKSLAYGVSCNAITLRKCSIAVTHGQNFGFGAGAFAFGCNSIAETENQNGIALVASERSKARTDGAKSICIGTSSANAVIVNGPLSVAVIRDGIAYVNAPKCVLVVVGALARLKAHRGTIILLQYPVWYDKDAITAYPRWYQLVAGEGILEQDREYTGKEIYSELAKQVGDLENPFVDPDIGSQPPPF